MKKMLKKVLNLFLSLAIGITPIASIVACGGGNDNNNNNGPEGQKYNTETRVFMQAIGAPDGNFNPFFSTSLYDSEIAGMTQVSLISSDENGKEAVGEDWPTVALDYDYKMYTTREVGTGTVTTKGSDDGRTEYEFLIKKGMKFSDGTDLTIKDVLFSIYVLLDPAYTGSATLYSTDIQGLNAYRNQDPTLTDDATVDTTSTFYANANARLISLITWSAEGDIGEELDAQGSEDLATVKKLFAEEATTDWTSVETSWEDSYEDNYTFTEAWQAYYYNEGLVSVQTRETLTGVIQVKIDENGDVMEIDDKNWEKGTYMTTLDPKYDSTDPNWMENEPVAKHLADGVLEATSSDKVSAYMAQHNCDEAYAKLQLQKEFAISQVVNTYTNQRKIAEVLSYWATGSKALEEFVAEERSDYYAEQKANGVGVDNVSGITTYKTTTFKGKDLGDTYDVLKIVINGIDPKAIWNFAIPVCPMHYYSDAQHTALAMADTENKHFGVEVGNKEFFDNVLKHPDKNELPVGAGAYMASNPNGNPATNGNDFFSLNVVRFQRNPYFNTMGAGIENAKIKYVNYKVMADDKIIDALTVGEIDYGEPNATPANQNEITATSFLKSEYFETNGYGYVGINPKYVPELEIRQAIMKAMNTSSIIKNYYGSALASTIYRPISKTSWAYPKGVTEYPAISFDSTADSSEILALVEQAGYTSFNSKGVRQNANGDTLTYTFTIAGESTDHPAYNMFLDAAETLNAIGFDITVKPDILALKKMTSGSLAVWAAAWSSGIDPDMYQIYHKDSRASSVNNWNRNGIINDTEGKFYREYEIVNELSAKIDEARSYMDEEDRAPIYEECLDLIMAMAVELPTYQRCDLCVYNSTVIDPASVNNNPTHNMGVISKIWEVNYL